MKVFIDNMDNGLCIEAESSSEAFALQKWYDEFIHNQGSKLRIIFRPSGASWGRNDKFGNCQIISGEDLKNCIKIETGPGLTGGGPLGSRVLSTDDDSFTALANSASRYY